MARPKVDQEVFHISLSSLVQSSSNPIYAGAYRDYDIAAILDTNLPRSLSTDHGKCGRCVEGSSPDRAGTGNSSEKMGKVNSPHAHLLR